MTCPRRAHLLEVALFLVLAASLAGPSGVSADARVRTTSGGGDAREAWSDTGGGARVAPTTWEPRGPGGGGALFSPSLSPHTPDTLFVACDMSELFRSGDLGRSFQALDFQRVQGNRNSRVNFTADPNVLYVIDNSNVGGVDLMRPSKSTNGGVTWTPLPGDPTSGEAWSLEADPTSSSRVLVGDYNRLFFSADGGQTFALRYTAATGAGLLMGGAFWDGAAIVVGTNDGLLVSTNGGASFAIAAVGGIPADRAILSFAGAKQGGTRRFYAIAGNRSDVYNGMSGSDHAAYRGVYVLDWGQASWTLRTTGIAAGDHPFFVGAPLGDISTAYLGGGGDAGVPTVYRTSSGGGSWLSVLTTSGNANVATGWSGQGGDRGWGYGECALGFAVSPVDPFRAVITDFGFVHVTEDGGASWRQAYVDPVTQNPAGSATPAHHYYRTNGIENTSVWSLAWASPTEMVAGYSDIRATRSVDGGFSWSFDYTGFTTNSMYRVVKASNGTLYAATSGTHDMYESTHLTDASIDGGNGKVLFSTDRGATWQTLHDFAHVVVWVATDPGHPNRLYASVAHRTAGDVYVTDNAQLGGASTWTRLATPPRTEGHPFNLVVLADGALLASYSGRRDSAGAFTTSAGVFLSTDGGASWMDRTDPGMRYWTRDVVVDPHDAAQNVWYAGVYSGWGGAPNGTGGLYRTLNRGVTWTRINAADRVGSATVSPTDPNELYFTTEVDGLYRTGNLSAGLPTFERTTYPFRHPDRVFFNPYDPGEVWVGSFGNGLRVGHAPIGPSVPISRYRLYNDVTKEHFYTTDLNEYTVLGSVGWIQEGVNHHVLSSAGPYDGLTPIPYYRFYHPGILQHFWTTDANEASVLAASGAWIPEGIDGYLLPTATAGSVPLYRLAYLFGPYHLWTVDANEYAVLATRGWAQEGRVGYVLP